MFNLDFCNFTDECSFEFNSTRVTIFTVPTACSRPSIEMVDFMYFSVFTLQVRPY